jgi:TrmH family RNA methyltransferase
MNYLELDAEGRNRYIKEKYNERVFYAGNRHGVIVQVEHIIKNSKPNPELLVPVEGVWAIQFAYKYQVQIKHMIICTEEMNSNESIMLLEGIMDGNSELGVYLTSKKVFDQISEKANSAGIIAVCKYPRKKLEELVVEKNSLVVILDGLEIPGNVGTIVRSADGTDVSAVIICNKKTRLTHPKYIKSSQGSCFKVPVVETDYVDVFRWLEENNFRIILTDTRADINYYEENFEGKVAVIVGSERYGISKEWYEKKYTGIKIPMFGDCDSLNVGIATTVILYEATLKKKNMLQRSIVHTK